ncbi:uncharacterized protein BO72DRAFT_527064 [Aspergillus fijiensis CBS 313.89]|uniref:Uncharacterized protein n=1 Tax=Aspergillus fijiensis CBS 313.89 TaxID=1448319 RepID=A0A8G1RS63_9EURO|nr:uncharacterized protein BO72DRAFT_527064 [Aspergillus fijiensis CBS 313.89]RAK78309.1 hypothetical protein BO72DRAFT_527064 [Aspergillus fijiensis CBS 313.89]
MSPKTLKPASLLVFEFRLVPAAPGIRRAASAKISIRFSSGSGSAPPRRTSQEAICFWSVVLYIEPNSAGRGSFCRIAGVIQADKAFDFQRVRTAIRGASQIYPMLLRVELYKAHVEFTAQTFEKMLRTLREVDAGLLKELKGTSKPDDERQSHRLPSKTLHECSMQLVELGQRWRFEKELGERLKKHTKSNETAMRAIAILAALSESREFDMQTLPLKVESQRNVLYGLIAPFDNNMQSRLAREALRDSKAMKTLSVITIVFLPGAFVATLFSTNMFSFQDNRQEVWIYFVISVPLTAVLLVAWILWLRNTPYGIDAEERGALLSQAKDDEVKRRKTD